MRIAVSALFLLAAWQAARAYPLDGAEKTGIRRLAGYRLVHEGKVKGTVRLPSGALRSEAEVALRLKGVNDGFDIKPGNPQDPYLAAGIQRIFGGRDPSYNLAILDISDPKTPRYGALRPEVKRIPGSVGKLLVATGLFEALRMIYPDDIAARQRVLKQTVVAADKFIISDGKTVPFYNPSDPAVVNRRLQIGDRFNLWEWTDHMLSQSSNAAASMVWKQVILLRHFGVRYPVATEEAEAFLRTTPKAELGRLSLESVEAALPPAGLDTEKLRIGTFFTRHASSVVPGTASYACPSELLRWLVRLEQGRLVDAWSSLELKKLLYFSRPRYRYASSPALNQAAVFFKSGSLFECVPEEGYKCGQYRGNKTNLMHSVAVVESGRRVYLVALMSNVLKVNSAVDHQSIATEIERLIQNRPE